MLFFYIFIAYIYMLLSVKYKSDGGGFMEVEVVIKKVGPVV